MTTLLRASAAAFALLLFYGLAGAQTMRAHFLNVGQGSAAILEFPCAAILLDTGGESNNEFDSTQSLMDQIDDFFRSRPDLHETFTSIVLTHPHIDHTRGVTAVLGKYSILNALTNGQEVSSGKAGQKALHKKVADSEAGATRIGYEAIRVRDIPADTGLTDGVIDPIDCSPAVDPKITALWGTADKGADWTAKDFDNQNNHSVVLRVDFGNSSLLLTGDLEEKGIAGLLTRYKNSGLLHANVYLVGHHGAANATTSALLDAISPDVAVISMGDPGRQTMWTAWAYGHPRKPIVDLLGTKVKGTRPSANVLVATGVHAFVHTTVTRAIYATGWDGTVVLEGDTSGHWHLATTEAASETVNTGAAAKIDLNSASADQLNELPMIGLKRARDIVADRKANGPFPSVDDLGRISGIGTATIEAIRPLVEVR